MLTCSRQAMGRTGRQYCSLKFSRLLYCLIRESKTWLNINDATVHNNTFYILKLREQLLKIQKLHNKLVVHVIYTHTFTRTAFAFEQIYLFRNAIDCKIWFRDCIWFRYMKSSTKFSSKVKTSSDSAPKFKAQLWRCHSQLAMHDEPLCLAQRKALFCNMGKSKSGVNLTFLRRLNRAEKHTQCYFSKMIIR